jgi:isocitrate lyase
MASRELEICKLQRDWDESPRWNGIERSHNAADVVTLRESVQGEHTLARNGSRKLWKLINDEPFLDTLDALTDNQAMQQVKAGLKAIYLSGQQVVSDANVAGETNPVQSMHLANSSPQMVKRINDALIGCDQVQSLEGTGPDDKAYTDYFAPIVADAEAGLGAGINEFELMKSMIAAGASGVHFEDTLSSGIKNGHSGGKVLVSTKVFVNKLNAARLAADLMDAPTVLFARTVAQAADLVASDSDYYDTPLLTGERTAEGFYRTVSGSDQAISRGLAYAPYADVLCCETAAPDLRFAKEFAEAIHDLYPGKMLAYNCSPTFDLQKNLDSSSIAKFQRELGAMGYKFQFITTARIHTQNKEMLDLAHA